MKSLHRKLLWFALAIGILAVTAGGWYVYQRDIIYPRHAIVRMTFEWFPERVAEEGETRNVRPVATVYTCFTPYTYVETRLFLVDGGKTRWLSSQTARNPSRYEGLLNRDRLTYGLGDRDDSESDPNFIDEPLLTHIRQAMPRQPVDQVPMESPMWFLEGSEVGGYEPFTVSYRETFPGTAEPDVVYLLYVEGTDEPNINREMTLEEFARLNQGKYLIMTVMLRRSDE